MNTYQANAPPGHGRLFYSIQQNGDGTVDVFLKPRVTPMTTPEGQTDYDVEVPVMRGVVPWDGMEDDIRARYEAWCESAQWICL